jgi:hypothetical protein
MSKVQSFVERCLVGTALPDEIDDYIDTWHDTDVGEHMSLHSFLGMDEHEYALWMRDPNAIYGIIKAHKNHRNVDDYISDYYSMPLAARAESTQDTVELTKWLKKLGKLE